MLASAVDQGIPRKTAEVAVTVYVRRNDFSPVFTEEEYERDVNETLSYSSVVVMVTAIDRDAELQPNVSIFNHHHLSLSVLSAVAKCHTIAGNF